jgi:hypothetical protein
MAAPTSGDSSSGSSAAATAAKLRDEALAAAKTLEDEAASLRSTNTERSQQLREDADLKSAAAAQERVCAAAAAFEKERAQADALEQHAAALRDRLRAESHRDDNSHDDDYDHSIDLEATAIAHLHSQAAAVQNIKNLIPIVLDLQSSNYSKWRGYVLLILGCFTLKDHVLSNVSRFTDPAWSHMDCVVVSWLFNGDGVSARAAWLGIEQQFLNNRESCAMLLNAEFRTLS